MGNKGDKQFSHGEQRDEMRKQFWATNYKQCPMCKSQNIAAHWRVIWM